MTIQIIEGEFSSQDAMELLTQMIAIKIRFHENKINTSENEEDIKAREGKIKRLQKNLFESRNDINKLSKSVKINATINFD